MSTQAVVEQKTDKSEPDNQISGSYLTFNNDRASYAIPVRRIVYITSLDAIDTCNVPSTSHQSNRVFTFQDQQIPLYTFCQLVGSHSQVKESADLIEMLAQRRQDHVDWMDALEHSIVTDEPFTKATNPHKCAFGKWYDQYESSDDQLNEIMEKFDEPHKRIHSLAEQLLDMAANQQKEEAIETLNREKHSTLKLLMNLFAQASTRLEDLLRPVVVIVQTSKKVAALELDSIEGIIDFSERQWMPEKGLDSACQNYDGFFQQEDGSLFIRLNLDELMGC